MADLAGIKKCHFAYMWQMVGGDMPSDCGICTPEAAFVCWDLPHISEMDARRRISGCCRMMKISCRLLSAISLAVCPKTRILAKSF